MVRQGFLAAVRKPRCAGGEEGEETPKSRTHGPFHTCEAVVLETTWVLGLPRGVPAMVVRGDLVLDPDFDFSTELPRLLALCSKYADREMDLADACLVRMTELTSRCKIWTIDREDFTAYRRQGRQPVPSEFRP